MANTLLNIVMIPVTGVGKHDGFRGDEWYEYRLGIFKEFTLRSLKNQSVGPFLWLTFRPEERDNHRTLQLANYMRKQGFQFVFTFDGLMYPDDKYLTKPKNILNILRWGRKNKDLAQRLRNSLDTVKTAIFDAGLTRPSWIAVTRIDSDDLFHKQEIEIVQDKLIGAIKDGKSSNLALVHKKGYIYNRETNELAEWEPKTNPPFHTILFAADDFFDVRSYMKKMSGYESHEDIPRLFETLDMPDYMYVVTTHGKNISTNWSHPFKGKTVEINKLNKFMDEEKETSGTPETTEAETTADSDATEVTESQEQVA